MVATFSEIKIQDTLSGNAENLILSMPQIAQLVKNLPAKPETSVWFLGREDLWRRDRLPTPASLGFPCGSAGKESACNAGDLGSIPRLERSPGKVKGYPLQYSGLENYMDCIVHGFTESYTTERLSLWLSCNILLVPSLNIKLNNIFDLYLFNISMNYTCTFKK